MKKSGLLTALLCLCLSTILHAAEGILPGTGTQSDPYLIEDLADFDYLVANYGAYDGGKYINLTCDIDLSGKSYTNYVINNITSIFDGGGHAISNLAINTDGSVNCVGFVGVINDGFSGFYPGFRNLNLQNVTVSGEGSENVGGLCGRIWYGKVRNCTVYGTVNGYMNVGLLVGYNDYGTIINCGTSGTVSGFKWVGGLTGCQRGNNGGGSTLASCSTADVSGAINVGGLIGENHWGYIVNSYASGNVSGVSSSAGLQCIGGFCGYNGGRISYSYSSGLVSIQGSTSQSIGGFCGYSQVTPVEPITNCFWDTDTSHMTYPGDNVTGVTGLPTSLMQTKSTFTDADWSFSDIPTNNPNLPWLMSGYPILSWQPLLTPPLGGGDGTQANPYRIRYMSDFELVVSDIIDPSIEQHFVLETDLDLSGKTFSYYVLPGLNGVFNGNGHTISNITIEEGLVSAPIGFFGTVGNFYNRSEVSNLCLNNLSISGGEYVSQAGGLCGINYWGIIINCSVSGNITGGSEMGLLIGCNNDGNVYKCSTSGTITGTEQVGGLVGTNIDGSGIIESYSTASVTGNYTLGGLVGHNHHSDIENCYATGAVSGGQPTTNSTLTPGGFCGHNEGHIVNCYSTGTVTAEGEPTGSFVGGFCGSSTNSFDIDSCFWDIDTSGVTFAGYNSGNATGMPTDDMIIPAPFINAGWDFAGGSGINNIWRMEEYPVLAWQNDEGEFTIPNVVGMTQSEAETAIADAGFVVGDIKYEFSDSVSKDRVISQAPVAGTETFDSLPINIVVSYGVFPLSGSGTEAAPYIIDDLSDFDGFCSENLAEYFWVDGVYTRLDCDIDLSGRIYETALIGPAKYDSATDTNQGAFYQGVLDGNGHFIRNLTINNETLNEDYLGLFGMISGSNAAVSELGVENISITVNGSNAYLGGFCGMNSGGTISQCFATGDIQGQRAGGFSGVNSGQINDCYSSCNIIGNDTAGFNCLLNDGYIFRCYSSSIVQSGNPGFNNVYSGGTIDSCFFDGELIGASIDGWISFETAAMQDYMLYTSSEWDMFGEDNNGTDDIWVMNGYPHLAWEYEPISGSGSSDDPFEIRSITDFNIFAGAPLLWTDGVYARLETDLDLDSQLENRSVYYKSPIGIFYGSFDGNGHVIKNMVINCNTYEISLHHVGFFAGLDYGVVVKNLGMVNCSINTNDEKAYSVGLLAGYARESTIENCFASGKISTEGDYVGGLVGYNYTATIDDCFADVEVAGYNNVGGLVGHNVHEGVIQNSYSTGYVNGRFNVGGLVGFVENGTISSCYASGNVEAGENVGGLCGYFDGQIRNCYSTGSVSAYQMAGGLCGYFDGQIRNCYSTGSVSAYQMAGGLCGYFNGQIRNCYATGDVLVSSSAAGGLVGRVYVGLIETCYSTGSVTGSEYPEFIGGLVGFYSGGYFNNCFWDIQTSGIADTDYYLGIEGKTTAQMQNKSTYTDAGWEFISSENEDAPWFMDDYPVLALLSDVVVVPDLSGMAKQEAEAVLGNAGLFVGNLHYVMSDTAPTDQIVSHFPAYPEYALPGSSVNLVISAGSPVELSGHGIGSDPYLINNLQDFDSFAFVPDYWAEGVHVKLMADLDLNPAIIGRSIYGTAVIAPDTDSAKSFFQGTAYNGIFNGNGNTIKNLAIDTDDKDNDYLGLFGKLGVSAEIIDLCLENAVIKAGQRSYYVGALGGENNGTISNCSSSGSISGSFGADHMGGLCGINKKGQIYYCYSSATVVGGINSKPVGGLISENAGGTILNSYFFGTVSGYNSVGGLCGINSDGSLINCFSLGQVLGNEECSSIGGLCGYNEWGEIRNCYSAGTVNVQHYAKRVGGLCGDNNEGVITNCYSTANIPTDCSPQYCGGFCGENYAGYIETCYSTGRVPPNNHLGSTGGFCGKNNAAINNCFWDYNTSGIFDSDGGIAKTTMEMQLQHTFVNAGWPLTATGNSDWLMVGNDYPKLSWQQGIAIKGNLEITLQKNQTAQIEIDIYSLYNEQFKWKATDIDKCPWISDFSPEYGICANAGDTTKCKVSIDSSGLAVGDYIFMIPIKTYTTDDNYMPVVLHVINKVDMIDFAAIAQNWLQDCTDQSCFDAEFSHDGVVDLDDLNVLASQWLEETFADDGFEADFETGAISSYGFRLDGDAHWVAQSQVAYQRSFSAQSGEIADSQQCVMEITENNVDCDTVSFVCKISSEAVWDTLNFYIDDVLQDQWSGELGWQQVSYPVSSGIHTFRWSYIKDESISEGTDAAWVDDIRVYKAE